MKYKLKETIMPRFNTAIANATIIEEVLHYLNEEHDIHRTSDAVVLMLLPRETCGHMSVKECINAIKRWRLANHETVQTDSNWGLDTITIIS